MSEERCECLPYEGDPFLKIMCHFCLEREDPKLKHRIERPGGLKARLEAKRRSKQS